MIKDDPAVLEFYANRAGADNKTLVHDVLSNTDFWGQDLTKVAGLEDAVLADLNTIDTKGSLEAMKEAVQA